MHEVDQNTENMVRSVLAYAENRLRMNPVPLDKGVLSACHRFVRIPSEVCLNLAAAVNVVLADRRMKAIRDSQRSNP